MLLFLFSRVWTLNKKLDELLKEEHEIKKELDQTKLELDQTKAEADEQLRLMKILVEEMSTLDKITKIGEKEIKYIKLEK